MGRGLNQQSKMEQAMAAMGPPPLAPRGQREKSKKNFVKNALDQYGIDTSEKRRLSRDNYDEYQKYLNEKKQVSKRKESYEEFKKFQKDYDQKNKSHPHIDQVKYDHQQQNASPTLPKANHKRYKSKGPKDSSKLRPLKYDTSVKIRSLIVERFFLRKEEERKKLMIEPPPPPPYIEKNTPKFNAQHYLKGAPPPGFQQPQTYQQAPSFQQTYQQPQTTFQQPTFQPSASFQQSGYTAPKLQLASFQGSVKLSSSAQEFVPHNKS